MRFTHQLTKHDCAPTAFNNACKYYGLNISYKRNYKAFKQIFEIDEYGTQFKTLRKLVKNNNLFPFKITKAEDNMKPNNIYNHLANGGTAILTVYNPFANGYHSFFIFQTDKYYAVNFYRKGQGMKLVSELTFEKLNKYISGPNYSILLGDK